MGNNTYYHISEAAERIGVHPVTLKRWFRDGKVGEVARDRKGWRIFRGEDIERIKEYAERIYEPPLENSTED